MSLQELMEALADIAKVRGDRIGGLVQDYRQQAILDSQARIDQIRSYAMLRYGQVLHTLEDVVDAHRDQVMMIVDECQLGLGESSDLIGQYLKEKLEV